MRIEPVTEIGDGRGLCTVTIRIAAGRLTHEAQGQRYKRERMGIPIDQCASRADFTVDGARMCRQHAATAALAHLTARPRTDADEIARPRCGCAPVVVRRVIIDHGTCAMGGCPYGGDF